MNAVLMASVDGGWITKRAPLVTHAPSRVGFHAVNVRTECHVGVGHSVPGGGGCVNMNQGGGPAPIKSPHRVFHTFRMKHTQNDTQNIHDNVVWP